MNQEEFENFVDNYNIEDDVIYQDFMQVKADRTENTKITYKKTLNDFCNANELPLEEMYNTIYEEQKTKKIVNDMWIEFSPNDINTHTKRYFNNFLQYIAVNKAPYKTARNENRKSTINHKVALLKSFFENYGLQIPNYEKKKEDDRKGWTPLTREDIEYVVNDSTLELKALWSFMMSTGMRESDCVNLTVRDFMEATAKNGYHNFVDVNEFIDKAPQDMIGYWDFYPQKTIKDNVPCKTFNNRESSNYTLQSLRKIKNDYLPRYNRRHHKDYKISKDSALFGSRRYNYLGHRTPNSITQAAHKENKKLRNYHIAQINDKIKKGEISEEDRDKEIQKIPVFHAHQLRKYFINTIRKNATNLSHAAIMEGHAPMMKNDPSYVKITKEDVEPIYKKAIYQLSLYEVDEDEIFDSKSDELRAEWADEKSEWAKEKIQLNEQIQKQMEMQREKDKEIAKLKAELTKAKSSVETFETRLANVERQMPHLNNTNPTTPIPTTDPFDMTGMLIFGQMIDYHKNNKSEPQWIDRQIQALNSGELVALNDIAFDLAKKESKKPEYDYEFQEILIKAIFEMQKNPELVEESMRYHNARTLNTEKIMRYTELLYDLLAENYLTDDERLAWEEHKRWERENDVKRVFDSESRLSILADKICSKFYRNVDDYLLHEINEEFVMKDIEEYFRLHVDEVP